MKILMFGRGTIATIYAWALTDAGHDVEFLVRPGRAAEYGDTVRLDLLDGRRRTTGERVTATVPVRLREQTDPGDGFDLVIVSVGHHRLAEAIAFVAPLVGDATVLVFGNVWAEPLDAVRPLDPEQVVWGFPQAGGGFGADGVLHGVLARSVLLGTAASPGRRSGVRDAFVSAGLRIRDVEDMRGWLWIHFVADAGMHSQGLRKGSLSQLIGDRRGLTAALRTAGDLLPVVAARGVDLRRHRGTTLPFRMPVPAAAAMSWATAHVDIARASLAAHDDPTAAEPRAVVADALAEADRLGIDVPALRAALG